MSPTAAASPGISGGEASLPVQRVYVWEAPVRLAHWLVFLSAMVLAATGFYIANPFFAVTGEARRHFFTGTVKAVHSYAAIVFVLSLLSRLAWMFLGNAYARWNQFIPTTRERARDLIEMLMFYVFLTGRTTRAVGHNALAGFTYIFTYTLLTLQALTGLGLYGKSANVHSVMHSFGFLADLLGPQQTRWLHHGFMWLLLGFIVHHVYSAVFFSFEEKTGTMESIFSGYKYVRPGEAPGASASPERR